VNAQLGCERLLAGRAAHELETLAQCHANAAQRADRIGTRQVMCVAFLLTCGGRMLCIPCFLHQPTLTLPQLKSSSNRI
jgi:hypothetical protein